MKRIRRFRAKLANLLMPARAERDLAREVAAHLALLEDEFERRGMPAREARLAALRAYGGVEQSKELHRDERSFVWIEQWVQDLKHAVRSLRKSPTFVAVALLSLAFGIGVNTAIFTLVNGVMLKRLPVQDPERVVQLMARLDQFDSSGFSYPVYRELSRQTGIFSGVIGFRGQPGTVETGSAQQKVDFQTVTGGYFRFFSARPELGRLLDEEDDRVEGARQVCVISHQMWRSRYGSDPRVLHQTVRLNGVPLEIVGVVSSGFVGAELQRRYDLWVPTALTQSFGETSREDAHVVWLQLLARVRPELSLKAARARLEAASRSIEEALPADRTNRNATYAFRDGSKGPDSFRRTLRDPLYILMGAVTLVLLVACANLANLFLAHTNERRQEFAIKLSLGVSRWRLMRQLLVETFLVSLTGGVAAMGLAYELIRFLLALFNQGNRYQPLSVSPDRWVLLFTFAACLITALAAGLYPAWRASRTEAGTGLKGGTRDGAAGTLMRRALILVQVALAAVLLFGAGLFTHSLRNLKTVELGYEIDRVLTVELTPTGPGKTWKRVAAPPAFAEVLSRVRQLPGVESASFGFPSLLSNGMMATDVAVKDRNGNSKTVDNVYIIYAGAGYFPTLRLPMVKGREFLPTDRAGAARVAIVNQRLASLLWPGEDPIGKSVPAWGGKPAEVVGLTVNTKYRDVRENELPIAYMAMDQMRVTTVSLLVRCKNSFASVERDVRTIVNSTTGEYQVSNAASMVLMRDTVIAQDRLLAFLSNLFGLLGTALALVGVYGLISYSVTRRTREIGIRMSVGARERDVLWLVVRESAMLLGAGALTGVPLALALAKFLEKLLYQVSPRDPWGLIAVVALLAAGGLAAAYFPGRRATQINPVEALRYD